MARWWSRGFRGLLAPALKAVLRNAGPVAAFGRALVCLLVGAGLTATAQQPKVTVNLPSLRGFKAPINQGNRMIALVSGTEAKPSLIAGQVQITEFRLETYRYAPDRQVELTIASPSGTFDAKGASSERAIRLASADGRFVITGEGWNWDQASGLLIVSNRVQTQIRRASTATNRPPVEVTADRFAYNLQTGDAKFSGTCVASEPGQARIRAGELSSRLGVQTERPESILATNDVAIEILRAGQPGEARGQAASYQVTPTGEQIEVTGDPTWSFGPGAGSANRLVLLPAKESYTADGNARLVLQAPARRGVISDRPDGAPRTAPPPFDIHCERIESGPEQVVFTGPVTVVQTNRLEMQAGRLVSTLHRGNANPGSGNATADLASLSSVTSITATENVHARLASSRGALDLAGQQMIYSVGEHPMIEVTGDPTWRLPGHEGRAQRFVIHPEVPTFQALEKVQVLLRPQDAGPANAAADAAATPAPVEITAESMIAEGREARFRGGVLARRDTWNLRSPELTFLASTNDGPAEIRAGTGVRLEYLAAAPRPAASADGSAANRPTRPAERWLASAASEALRWTITAQTLLAGLAPRTFLLQSLDAAGDIHIDSPVMTAAGGRLVSRPGDPLLRLVDHARLQTVDGFIVIGEPQTALAFDPKSGKFRVEGPVQKMTVPGTALRGHSKAGAPSHRVPSATPAEPKPKT